MANILRQKTLLVVVGGDRPFYVIPGLRAHHLRKPKFIQISSNKMSFWNLVVH